MQLFNVLYNRLPGRAHEGAHTRFAKIFREGNHSLADGQWVVSYAGREIKIPLRHDRAWLDWDAALSILGHESTIKQTYATLLTARTRPDLFIDIGGNYGTHSLLFLVSGVDTFTFEPNTSCHSYFLELCELNGVRPRLEHAALGAEHGRVDLYFPERETWLGSLEPEVIDRLQRSGQLRHENVAVRKLDDYLPRFGQQRTLVKIDVEDHELAVLGGAVETLRRLRPLVLFETHRGNRRQLLFDFLKQHNYLVAEIPLLPNVPLRAVSDDEFVVSSSDNFIAVPAELFSSAEATMPEQLFARSS